MINTIIKKFDSIDMALCAMALLTIVKAVVWFLS